MFPFIFKGEFYPSSQWIYKPFEIQTPQQYNQKNYFYAHVQDALYGSNQQKDISSYYEYAVDNATYHISCKQGEFDLDIDKITLRIFKTGIAILSISLNNQNYQDPKDILAINDFGRRIYPPFLGGKDAQLTQKPKSSLLAYYLSLSLDGLTLKEDFKAFDSIAKLSSGVQLPKFINHLLEPHFKGTDILPVIDDRMFTISLYLNDKLADSYKFYDNEKDTYAYESDAWWYEFVFVDGDGKTCTSKKMTKKFITESSYDRWVEYGTLFGISRYSFVALSTTDFGQDAILPQMKSLYFDMFTLLLSYRASIIKFSDEIQDTTNNKKKHIAKDMRMLYGNYLDFLNQLFFKEVTAQDQGIEIYKQAMSIMQIDMYMSDLDNEINELHNYVKMIQEERENKKLNTLNRLAGFLLPASVLSGIAGMNILPSTITDQAQKGWEYLGGFAIVTILATWLILKLVSKDTKD